MLDRTPLYNATRLSSHSICVIIAHNDIFYHVRRHLKGIILIPKYSIS